MERKNYLQRFIYSLENKIQQSEMDWKGSRFASPSDSDTLTDDDDAEQQQYEEYLEKYRRKNGDIKPLGLVLYSKYLQKLAYLFLILTFISLPRILLYYFSGGLSNFQTSKSFSQTILQISIANLPHYHIDNLTENDLQEIEIYRFITILSDVISIVVVLCWILYWKVLSTSISNEYTAKSPNPNLYCLEISHLKNTSEK